LEEGAGEERTAPHLIAVPGVSEPYAVFEKKVKPGAPYLAIYCQMWVCRKFD
jgi:hypothetical protein